MKGIMFYAGDAEHLNEATSIPMPGWKPYFWRRGIEPQEVDDKVLTDRTWSIACIIDGKQGKVYSRREFLLLARPNGSDI